MPFADSDGVGISYDVIGEDADETVVFVSGLGYGRWMWDWQHPAFEGEYSVLRWDLRGIGESDTPDGPYTLEAMAADLEAVLADAGIESPHLVGVSMGGMIAQEYAIGHDRIRSLALISTDCGGDSRIPAEADVTERLLNPPEDAPLREQIRYKMAPAFTDEFREKRRDIIETILDYRTAAPVSDEVRGWQAAAVHGFDATDRLDAITVPTVIVHGKRDRVVPVENARELERRLPHAEVELLDDGGSHLVCIERAETVNNLLRTFIDGQ